MISIPLSDSVRDYRVVEVFVSSTDYSAFARIIGSSVLIGQDINFSNIYGNYSYQYRFTSETTFGMQPSVAYIPDGINFLIIGYNFA